VNEFLIVRLNKKVDQAVQWLVWSEAQSEVIASGEFPSKENINELATYAEGRRTILLLSAQNTAITEIEIPSGAQRQIEGMLPYLLEDDLAQDVEELHFTLLKKEQGVAQVCAVDSAWLSDVLDDFANIGCQVYKILPDVLALPDAEEMSAVQIDDQWLIKKSKYSGISVDKDWLELVARSDWAKKGEDYLSLTAFSALPPLDLVEEQSWQEGKPTMVMQLLAEQAVSTNINLLTGAFKPSSSFGRYWKVWRKFMIAAMVLLCVTVVDNILITSRYETQAANYRAESERIFRQSLPGKTKIPHVRFLKEEMGREANRLAGSSGDDAFLSLMNKLPPLLSQIPALSMSNFKYDAGKDEIRIQAQSKDFQTFERAAELLAKEFQVEQGQLNRSGSQVNGSFVLKPL
jgi:general secretion pathway protein L